MSDSSSVKVDEEEITIDPKILFQGLISIAKGSVQVHDLDTFFSFELCTYSPPIFESAHLLRDAKNQSLLPRLKNQPKLIATSRLKRQDKVCSRWWIVISPTPLAKRKYL